MKRVHHEAISLPPYDNASSSSSGSFQTVPGPVCSTEHLLPDPAPPEPLHIQLLQLQQQGLLEATAHNQVATAADGGNTGPATGRSSPAMVLLLPALLTTVIMTTARGAWLKNEQVFKLLTNYRSYGLSASAGAHVEPPTGGLLFMRVQSVEVWVCYYILYFTLE